MSMAGRGSEINRRAAIAALCLCAWVAPAAAQQVTSDQVARAIQNGVTYLRRIQRRDGTWPERNGYDGGHTSLVTLALLNAGVPPSDPDLARALDAIARTPNEKTYVVSLKCQALAAAGVDRHRRALEEAAGWLVAAQLDDGMWTYDRSGRGDNSNTQFALLGLHEAAKAGVKIPAPVWNRSRLHFEHTQLPDRGWTYIMTVENRRKLGRGGPSAYGSMTAAGVASLYVCGEQLHVASRRAFVNGVYLGCGRYSQNPVLAGGLEWLTDHFTVRTNPRKGNWLHYYLYALERVGMISGLRNFGPHDWYRQGAEFLVAQQRPDGSWGNQPSDTAFALLFLAKGNRPVIVQKYVWADSRHRNVHALENFTAFLDDKLGQRTTWQTVTLALPLRQLRQAPILLITGHRFPEFDAAQTAKLQEFVESGGTLLFEACCTSRAFAEGFRRFAPRAFPDYPLRPLPIEHPVFTSLFELPSTYGLEGIDVGCRTGVFFSPNPLTALWELQTVPDWSERAFRVGANVAAYATGREQLPGKLDVVELPEAQELPGQVAEVPRGAVRIARLIHNGDYNADPHAMVRLAEMLRDRARIDVVARSRHLDPADERLYEYPVLFMNGHYSFEFSEEGVANLREYLRRGGFLLVSNCCGRPAFDASFRKLAGQLFPEHPLTPLPPDHPIYTGKVGVPLGELHYREILAKELGRRSTPRPPLEEVRVDGRAVLIYSPYDFCCALEGDNPYSCRGYVDEDGKRLALNLALYAISW